MLPEFNRTEDGRILILAGNYEQFNFICHELKLSLKEVRYISISNGLFTYKNVTLYLYGEYWKNPIWEQHYIPGLCRGLRIQVKIIRDKAGKITVEDYTQ